LFSFLFFFDFDNKKIPTAATTRQLIHTTGLTAIHANPITTNHSTNVKQKAIIPVHKPMTLDKNGITLARVSTNCIIIEKARNIRSNPPSLIIQVVVLFACCACWNISSAVTFHCSNKAKLLPFEVV
jgi:hypothetical protein